MRAVLPVPKRSAMHGESGFERRALDAYWTEPRVTEAMCGRVELRGQVWEPATGRGDMARVLRSFGNRVTCSDITMHDPACCDVMGFVQRDFFEFAAMLGNCRSIVTNPPYEHAQRFITHALNLTRPVNGMVVMLLRHEFDCAAGRRALFDRPPFSRKLVLTFRPNWTWWESDAANRASPRHNFAWYVWDWARPAGQPATLEYLP